MGSEAQEIITGLKSEAATLRTSLAAALEREKDLELKVELLRDVLEATRARGQQLVEELSVAVEALEGCWARLKTDRELVEKHAGLGKVYDGLVEDAESALAAASASSPGRQRE